MANTDEYKCKCPHCGQHLALDASLLNTEIVCPTCGNPLEFQLDDDMSDDGSSPENAASGVSVSEAKSGNTNGSLKVCFARLGSRTRQAIVFCAKSACFVLIVSVLFFCRALSFFAWAVSRAFRCLLPLWKKHLAPKLKDVKVLQSLFAGIRFFSKTVHSMAHRVREGLNPLRKRMELAFAGNNERSFPSFRHRCAYAATGFALFFAIGFLAVGTGRSNHSDLESSEHRDSDMREHTEVATHAPARRSRVPDSAGSTPSTVAAGMAPGWNAIGTEEWNPFKKYQAERKATDKEYEAMGRVLFAQTLFMDMGDASAKGNGNPSSEAQTVMGVFFGMGAGLVAEEIDTTGCPNDFVVTWKKFITAEGASARRAFAEVFNAYGAERLTQEAKNIGRQIERGTLQKADLFRRSESSDPVRPVETRTAHRNSNVEAKSVDEADTESLQVEKESMLERVRKGNLMPYLLDGVNFNAMTGRYEIPEKHRFCEEALKWNQVLDQDEHRHGYSWESQVASTLQSGGAWADAAETMLNRYLSGELSVPTDGNGSFDPKTGRIVPERRGAISASAQAWNLALSIDEIRFGYSWERTRMLGPRKIRRWSFFHQFINGTVERPPLSMGEVFDWQSGKIVRKDGKDLSGRAQQFNIRAENAMSMSGRSWQDCLSEWRNLPPLSRDERAVRSFAEQVVRGEVKPPLSVGETINMDTGEIYRPDGRPISGAAQQWNIDVDRDCLLFGYTWKDERNVIANDGVASTAPPLKPKRKSGMSSTEFPKPPKVKRPVW